MIGVTVVIALINSVAGYYLAVAINGSIAGAIVTVSGIIFLLVFVFERLKIRAFIRTKDLISQS